MGAVLLIPPYFPLLIAKICDEVGVAKGFACYERRRVKILMSKIVVALVAVLVV